MQAIAIQALQGLTVASILFLVSAGLSLSFWLVVLLLGRLLPAFEGSTSFL